MPSGGRPATSSDCLADAGPRYSGLPPAPANGYDYAVFRPECRSERKVRENGLKYNGPKVKQSRKLGLALTPKASKTMEKKNYGPGMHGMKRKRRQTNYGRQLLEKQRLRFQYNVSERQLRNYSQRAAQLRGVTGETLVRLLETRLDSLVQRAGFAPTIFAARQVVGHGHISVNGKRVNLPSYGCREGDVIEIKEPSRKLRMFNEPRGGSVIPSYVDVDDSGYKATLRSLPRRDEVPVICDVPLVVEFYSR